MVSLTHRKRASQVRLTVPDRLSPPIPFVTPLVGVAVEVGDECSEVGLATLRPPENAALFDPREEHNLELPLLTVVSPDQELTDSLFLGSDRVPRLDVKLLLQLLAPTTIASATHSMTLSRHCLTKDTYLVDLPSLALPRADPPIEHDPPTLGDPRLMRVRPPLERLRDVLRERLGDIGVDLTLQL